MFSTTNIVDLMDGGIAVQSEEGYPSCVRVHIGEMSCGMPQDRIEDIDMWLHELVEYDLYLLGMLMGVHQMWNGFPINTPAHWVAALLTGTNWVVRGTEYWEYCSPEEYGECRLSNKT